MSDKPWREQGWDEWCELWDCAIPNDRVDFAQFREATDEKRAEMDAGWQISVKATEKAIDALCARVWREAQAAWIDEDDQRWIKVIEGRALRLEAAIERADRLAAMIEASRSRREWCSSE